MYISTLLSALKVINEVMKLLNDIEEYTSVYYHYTYIMYTANHADYAGILEYPVPSALVDWQLVYVVSTQLMPQSMLHL